ncbi:hypothetical protein KC878_01920 [Candidatus Saccharibacteria bacterium]|nr:hypothetical protein [Candidatus Saccharibacteria bacterium]
MSKKYILKNASEAALAVYIGVLILNILIVFSRVHKEPRFEPNSDYYSSVASIIPLFLIAIYLPRGSYYLQSRKVIDIISELITRILPAILATGGSLYALANKTDSNLIFSFTVIGLTQLSTTFILQIVFEGILTKDTENH